MLETSAGCRCLESSSISKGALVGSVSACLGTPSTPGSSLEWGLSSQQSVQRYQTFLMMACTDKYIAKIDKIAKIDNIDKVKVVNIS